jgi:hypothetical protein
MLSGFCGAVFGEGARHQHVDRRHVGDARGHEVRCSSPSIRCASVEDVHPHCRGAMRPGFAWDCSPRKTSRGRRESRMRAAPAVSCAKENRKRTRAYRFSGGNPAFPARWGTAYSALSPVTGYLATVAAWIFPRDLTPASGRQDHTASPSAPPALLCRRPRVHRIPPRVRDDREPPLSSGETRGVMPVICTTC